MVYVLNDLVNGTVSLEDYQDYLVKSQNKNYKEGLENVKQLSVDDFRNFIIDNYDDLIKEINSIKQEFLYDSVTHGISHNIKVLLFSYYLAKKFNLDSINFQIVMDASKYHDVGRRNDLYDEEHGKRSANAVDKIVDNQIYQDKDNLNLLKSIIEYHSIPDRNMNKVLKKYSIKDENRFKILACLLKDADGLDRVRLSINHKLFSDLNPKYLRFEDSLKLVEISHIINSMYINSIKNKKEGIIR